MARRKQDGLMEDFHGLFMRIPAWACIPISLFAFLFVTVLIIAAGAFSPPLKALAGMAPALGGMVALMILLAGFKASMDKWSRRAILAKQTGIESIRQLSWSAFELLVGEAYRQQGYAVEETGGAGADGGIDLKLHRNGTAILVQCKHWKTWKVGVPSIREFYGVLMSEKADRGIFITSGVFTSEARAFAQGKPLELIAGDELPRLIRPAPAATPARASSYVPPTPAKASSSFAPPSPKLLRRNDPADPIRATETAASVPESSFAPPALVEVASPSVPSCPKCSRSMVLRTARKGANTGSQFWGCSTYPVCKGIRNA
jgi:restriction system protein